ncbi:hypothetical protein BDC45DRAFT_451010 [Circinella umbellata]|nr:hypothetical protein BDC45DRAFT_451010 [Circinella umbellata]
MAHHQERKRSRRQQYHDPGSNIIVEPTRTEQQIIHDNDSNNNNTNNNHGIIEEDTEEEVFPEINDVDWDTARHNPTAVPRRQKLRYGGDEYTPKWVRYTGQAKEGYCDSCKPGKWLQLKNSAYWYHKQFFHGISSVSGKRFMEPLKQRAGDHDVVEGLCHQCHQFVPICNAKRKTSVLWYRHAHKCHIYDKPKSTAVSKRNNSLSNSKKFFT